MSENFNNDSMIELYLLETTTLLEGLDDILLQAEQAHTLSDAETNEIFRIMHTIKGSSAMMSYDIIATVSHRIEDLFSVIRDDGLDPSKFDGLFDIVLKASEFLESEVEKLQNGESISNDTPELLGMLEAYAVALRCSDTNHEKARITVAEKSEPSVDISVLPSAYMPEAPEGGRILGLEPVANTGTEIQATLAQKIKTLAEGQTEAPIPVNHGNSNRKHAQYELGKNINIYMHVFFNDGARMENVRAFMLLNKLSEYGKIARTIPAELENNPEASDQIVENGFYINLTTHMFREQIEAIAKSTLSVESVSFLRRMPDEERQAAEKIAAFATAQATYESAVHFETEDKPAGHAEEPSASPEINAHKAIDTPVANAPNEATPISDDCDVLPASFERTKPAKQSNISVNTSKLDTMLDLVGEIVINKSMVTENPDLNVLKGDQLENFNKVARHLGRLTDELQDSVMSIRMVPVSSIFTRMRKGLRDMSKQLGKNVELSILNETMEADKAILDAIIDPVIHLLRNAVDHAIEMPDERIAAGKNPIGQVTLSAQNAGSDIIISVSDDGRGLDRDQILKKAKGNNLLKKLEDEYTDKEVYNLLMTPGFSLRDKISEYSGRGVGLDIVKMNAEKIGGTVIIESAKGAGTNVMMKIPLTLSIIDCMEIRIGSEIFAVPLSSIQESFKSNAEQFVVNPNGEEMIMFRGQLYPVVRVYEKFGIADAVQNMNDGILMLTGSAERTGCILVDELIGKFQVVVKSIPEYLKQYGVKKNGISGCTIMGDGNVSLILDIQELLS